MVMYLDPAKTILGKIGIPKAAEITGRHVSRIYRWMYSAERGGTGGLIPQQHHRALLDYAKRQNIPLSADEFVGERAAS